MIETLAKTAVASLATISALLSGAWSEPDALQSSVPEMAFEWDTGMGRMVVTAAAADLDWSQLGVVRIRGGEGASVQLGDPSNAPAGDLHNEAAIDGDEENEVPWEGLLRFAQEPTPLSAGDFADFCATAPIDEVTLEVRSLDQTVVAQASFGGLPVCGEERAAPSGPDVVAPRIVCGLEGDARIVVTSTLRSPSGRIPVVITGTACIEGFRLSRWASIVTMSDHHDCMHLPKLPPIPTGFAESNQEAPAPEETTIPRPFTTAAEFPVEEGASYAFYTLDVES